MKAWRIGSAAILAVVLCMIGAGVSLAQPYPMKPIRLIVPWPPGGSTDILARMVAQKLAEALGQPMIIDNRAGAGGMIGSDVVAKSSADGYTLLMGSSGPISISPSLQPKMAYDSIRDFAPISLIATPRCRQKMYASSLSWRNRNPAS
jgi:tripartite-type tricarboxylate transporter receptor subunit TctC